MSLPAPPFSSLPTVSTLLYIRVWPLSFSFSSLLAPDFISGYIRFRDGTRDELLRQFHAANLTAQTDSSIAAEWDSALNGLNPAYSLRILFERLSPNPRPCFYAGLEGVATGPFDVVLDSQRDEPFLLGQVHKAGGGTFYDVWTSHRLPDSFPTPAAFPAIPYSLETTLSSNNSREATSSASFSPVTGAERILAFQLSRALTIDGVTGEHVESFDFFQNDGMSLQERSDRGNDYLDVVLSHAPPQGQEFTLHFHS